MEILGTGRNHSFSFDNDQKPIVKTWQEILGIIRINLIQDNDQVLLSDIDQIIGLCETIDNNSFQPFQSEDFSPSIARRINSYYDLADKVIDELKKRGLADTKNLNATPQKYGYTRYFRLGALGFSLNVRFDFWERIADTPFWLTVKDDTTGKYWMQTEQSKSQLKNQVNKLSILSYENNKRELFLPIFPLTEKTEDLVVNDIAHQILNIANEHRKDRLIP